MLPVSPDVRPAERLRAQLYSPGARPLDAEVPSGRIGPALRNVEAEPCRCLHRHHRSVIGRPSDSVALPLTRVGAIGFSAMTMFADLLADRDVRRSPARIGRSGKVHRA